MSNDTEHEPPVQLVSERPGVIWRASQLVITAAGECAREFRAGGARPATLELLAIAYEQLGAALDGEILEPIDLEARYRVRRPDEETVKGGTES
jgi:hypothetical protein